MMKIIKTGFLIFFWALLSSAVPTFAAQQVDLSQAKQMCNNATPQQKQMAKAAGYNLDSLCSQLQNNSSMSGQKDDTGNTPVVNPRATKNKSDKEFQDEQEQNPLSLFTPEQIAAMTPEQLARILQDIEEKAELEELEPLKAFGYELFAGEPTSFAPANNIPVPVNYVIGPGDTLEIQLFGKMSQQLSLVVNRNGQINFPELGPISLAGLSFAEAKSLLHKRIKEQMIGVDASISLGELRSIQVFLLGEAYKPGSYTVSSLSTITNALFVSGGISDIGSLRNIQLKRQGKLITTLDLYDLLLKGDTRNDQRLLPGDVIYIPPVGTTVSVDGAVKRPAIYELKSENSVERLIELAGGLGPTAYKQEAQLTRVNEQGFTTIIEVNNPQASSQSLKSGDHLQVRERVEVNRGSVKLTGHVYRQKKIAWKPGLKVTDLVTSVNALKPLPQLESAILVRETLPLRNLTIQTVNLKKALNNRASLHNLALQPQDELIVLGYQTKANASGSRRNERLEQLITSLETQASSKSYAKIVAISGMVRFPGQYPLANNMTVDQLIAMAGGLAESAYTLNGEVTRISMRNPEHTQIEHHSIKLTEGEGVTADNFKLQSRDVVNIRQRPDYREFALVEVDGEVKFPGTYRIKKGETLKDLMKRVGGFTDFAHVEAAVFTREELKEREEKQLKELRQRLKSDIANSQLEQANVGKSTNLSSLEQLSESLDTTEALGRLVIDLKSILANKTDDVILKGGDMLVIPSFRQEVSVVGEVQYPTSHLFDQYLTFEEYIERSGGETDKADDERIYIVKADGSVTLPYKSGWVNAMGVKIEPGDTIVVPLDVDATNSLDLWTKVSQVVYQLALGAAAITRI
jgi:protein involved in polysaccharide export with SLBB domain